MKLIYTISFLAFTACIYSQDTVIDTLAIDNENLYIDDHKTQFNVKFDVSNDIIHYNLPSEGIKLSLKPNLNIKYAFVFSYKFASIRIGFRPRLSNEDKENKGDSNSFRLRLQLLFDNWSHLFEYNYDKGYYVVNSQDFIQSNADSKFHIQFPNLTSNVFFGSSFYKFNKNYSVRAIQSQTEIQIKSAGSFMPGVNYTFYGIKGNDIIKLSEDEIIIRENYNDTNGFNLTVNAGYYYTFVFHKYWYANAYVVPGAGIDFYNITSHSSSETIKRSHNDLLFSLQSGIGMGYNAKKIFFGAEYANKRSSEKFNESKVQLNVSKDIFHIFIGYRFKAPKKVTQPIDKIEDKIPILKDDKNKV
jgi:hypothetical protein